MESPILRSRKRKQPPPPTSNPFIGMLTRSKSKIYLHHRLSGGAKLDSIVHPRNCSHTQMLGQPITKHSSLAIEEPFDVNSVSCGSIKDLRTRRVFSPASTIENECFLNPFETEDCVVKGDTKKRDAGSHCLVEDSNDKTANLELSADLCSSDTKNIDGSILGDRILNDNDAYLSKKCFEKTLPDVEEHEGNGKKNGLNLNGDFGNNKNVDQRNLSIARSKLVLSSCGRRKIFKTPTSFSYRRLLPFLADITKDDSCVSKIEEVDVGLSCKVRDLNDVNHKKCEEIGACLDDKKSLENGGIKKNDTPLLCRAKDLDSINPYSSPIEDKTGLHNVDGDFQHRVDVLMEENIQMTPPDADIFSKPEESDPRASKEDNSLQTEDHVQGKLSYSGISRNDGCVAETSEQNSDWRNNSIPNSQLVLNPCSRVKVFKTPSSVSYRRLLPFLMQMAKDSSCSPKTHQCQKLGKDLEEKPKQPQLASLHQYVPTDGKSETDSLLKENFTADEKPNLPTATLATHDGLSDKCNLGLPIAVFSTSGSCNDKEPVSVFSDNLNSTLMPLESEMECASELEHVIPGTTGRLEAKPPHGENCSAVPLCSTVNHRKFPRECASEVSQDDLLGTEGHCVSLQKVCHKDDEKTSRTACLNQSSSLVAAESSQIYINGTRKGILKMNRRGCRGLCNCLNCASFRLHAERAFEFSRNQMQDAEEVAFELINELAYLRNMLKKSADAARDHALIPLNQVEEACMKALNTENLAKKRLGQMNDDLKIHCRITCSQRPRVTFASYIDEKVIPEAHCQDDCPKD